MNKSIIVITQKNNPENKYSIEFTTPVDNHSEFVSAIRKSLVAEAAHFHRAPQDDFHVHQATQHNVKEFTSSN